MNTRGFATAILAVVLCASLALIGGCSSSPRTSIAQADQQVLECPDCTGTLDARGWCTQCNAGFAQGLKTSCPSCLTAIQSDGWCQDCKVGYAKGAKTKCPSCLKALQSDGWCEDCKVGYVAGKKTSCKTCFAAMSSDGGAWCSDCGVGYSKGLKTKCRTCFAAIAVNGTCQDCGVRFQDGRSFEQVVLHVEALDSDGKIASLRQTLGALTGVSSVGVDRKSGEVSFEVETTQGQTNAPVIHALTAAGYVAHVRER
jgi:hypothetical protein